MTLLSASTYISSYLSKKKSAFPKSFVCIPFTRPTVTSPIVPKSAPEMLFCFPNLSLLSCTPTNSIAVFYTVSHPTSSDPSPPKSSTSPSSTSVVQAPNINMRWFQSNPPIPSLMRASNDSTSKTHSNCILARTSLNNGMQMSFISTSHTFGCRADSSPSHGWLRGAHRSASVAARGPTLRSSSPRFRAPCYFQVQYKDQLLG